MLPHRKPLRSQPQGPFSLAAGWDFGWTPGHCSARPVAPLAHHSIVPTQYGLSMESNATAGGAVVSSLNDAMWNFGTDSFTVVAVYRIGSIWTGGQERYVLGSVVATNHWGVFLRSDGTNVTVRDSSNLAGGTFNILADDVVVSVHTRNNASHTRKYRVLNRPQIVGEATNTNTGAWYLRTANAMQVGGIAGGGWPGGVLAVGMRRSPVADLDGLIANPWQLFAPRRIWVPVTAAPTGPTVTALLRQRSQFIGSGLR